jgi:GNAT superfamily N-acetyltransferase
MTLSIETAQLSDIEELLKLYLLIYGRNYPLQHGTDQDAMADAIESPEFDWLIMRDQTNSMIVGSIVFELDRPSKLGKVSAMVVHPEYQGAGIASQLTSFGDRLISPDGSFNSLYTTARTHNIGPQLVFLREGYLPLGIFPNAHKLRWRETTTFLAKFKPGVLEKRVHTERIPQKMLPLYSVVHEKFPGIKLPCTDASPEKPPKKLSRHEASFESIFAPEYVLRRFKEQTDAYSQFYPFHRPNLLLAETTGTVEVFAYVNKSDGYCTLINCNRAMFEIEELMPALLEEMHSIGISYVEVLIAADRFQSLETLLRMQFLPSGLYPAMREIDGKTYDYVIMTHTMEPLDFRGMAIEQAFKPFVDQYVATWKQMHLDTLEVFNDYKYAPRPGSAEADEHSEALRDQQPVPSN